MSSRPSTLTKSAAKTPLDAREQRSREHLRAAMLALITREDFAAITIRAIAQAAGIGYATFFRHYPSKEALLDDVAGGEITALLTAALPMLFADAPRDSCLELVRIIAARREIWRALLAGGAAPILRQQFIAQARGVAARHGAMEGWLPSDLRIVHGVSASIEILGWWLAQPEPIAEEQMAEIIDRLVVTPVMAR